MKKRQDTLIQALGAKIADELSGGSAGANTAVVASLPPAQRAVATEAYTQSLRSMWIFYVAVAAVGLLISLGISRQTLSKKHEVTRTGLDEQKKGEDARAEEERIRKYEKRRSAGMSMDVEKGEGAGITAEGLKGMTQQEKEADAKV